MPATTFRPAPQPLYLSPAGVRTVRSRVTPADRERLDQALAAGTIRTITKESSA